MISITCKSCQKVLTIDEAFAGGVCRCDACGAIQTVPAKLKQRAVPQPVATSRKPASNADLQELADLVSSGLAGSGLRSQRQVSYHAATRPPFWQDRQRLMPALIGAAAAGGVALLIAVAAVWMMLAGAPAGDTPVGAGGASVPAGPSFGGVGLTGSPVVYVLDRGSATLEVFDLLMHATYRSIESLGPSRRFQIVFWETEDQTAWPGQGPVDATPENLAAAQRALMDIAAWGQSDARSALERAMLASPAEIVLATGKGWDLDADFVTMVEQARGGRRVRIHTFSLGDDVDSEALRRIAESTGGQYRDLSAGELRVLAR